MEDYINVLLNNTSSYVISRIIDDLKTSLAEDILNLDSSQYYLVDNDLINLIKILEDYLDEE